MKRVWKLALLAGGALLLLWIVAMAVLWLLFPAAKVKAIVLDQAGKTLHREVKLESASLKLFPFLGVSLGGLEIANNPDSGFSKDPMLSLGALEVKLSVASLFKFSPVVSAISLRDPKIRIETLPDGRSSLDGLGGPKDSAEPKPDSVKALELPFPLSVEKFSITNGSVAWLDRKNGQEITLGDIEQSASFSTDKSLENATTKGDLSISDISISGKGMPVRKGGIRLHLSHDLSLNLPGAVVEIREVRASLQDVAVKLSGRASNILVTPELDLQLGTDGPIDLKKLLSEIPKEINPALAKLAIAGEVTADFKAKGKVSATSVPVVDGSIHVRDFSASVAGLPAKLSGFRSAIHVIATQSVEIDSTSWLLDRDPGSLSLAIDSLPVPPYASRKPWLRHLAAEGKVDLKAFAQVFSPLVPALDSLKPSGILGWKVAGKGRLDPAKPTGLEIRGDATLSKVSAHLSGISDRPVVDGSANLTNTSVGAKIALAMGPTDLSLDAKISDWLALAMPKLAEGKITSVTLAAKSKFIDVDKFLPPPDTNPKAPTELPEELPELPAVNLSATFNADLIQAMGLKISKVSAKTGLSGGLFQENISGTVAQGGIVQSLKADLRNRKLLDLVLDAKLNGVQIHEVLVGMKDRLPAGTPRKFHDKLHGKGNVTLSAHVKAPIREASKKLSADIKASFSDGKIVNFPALSRMLEKAHGVFPAIPVKSELEFANLALSAELRDGALLVRDLDMDGSSLGQIMANGSISTDQSLDFKVDTHLPQSVSGGLQSAAGSAVSASGPIASALGMTSGSPLPQDDKKRVVLSWLVKGPFASPSVSYDLPRISDLAKGVAAALASEAKAKAEAAIKEQTDKLKAEAQAKFEQEKAKAKAEIEKKATDAVKQQAGEGAGKAVDAVKGKLKKMW